jgi:hypothetical protein
MGTDNGDPEDSWSLLMRELFQHLGRRADQMVARAIRIAIDLTRGYKPAEIQARHALTPDEYREAAKWARSGLDAMRRDEGSSPAGRPTALRAGSRTNRTA